MDSRTDLAEEFGFRFSASRLSIRGLRDKLFPEERIAWQYAELVPKFDVDRTDRVFCVDAATEAPMVVGMSYGAGKVLFLNSRFDPYTQQGYSRYPFLLEYVRRYFQLRPIVRREKLEMYFEPGLRHNYSIESLVRLWVTNGIHIVHVAGWHQYPKYTYDYERLIRLAHANGILVYAWLEPPQVSQKFWTDHPEWREKNYKGQDAPAAWRYAVALTDRQCVLAMLGEYTKLLSTYDWDGVNLSELYFESGRGFVDPNLFTPGHPSAQKELKRLYQIDLPSVFDPASPQYWRINQSIRDTIVWYRVQKLTEVYDTLLTAFEGLATSRPGFQIIVTAMDSYGSPELREQNGVDMDEILSLQRHYKFILQVEDPQSRWSTNPRRYVEIGRKYARMMNEPDQLMLDLNILTFRSKDSVLTFPTLIQTGTESFELVRAASIGAPRFSVYSEQSVNGQDLALFPYALASDVQYQQEAEGFSFHSHDAFVLQLPPSITRILVDGTLMIPYRTNRFLLPAGNHRINFQAGAMGAFSAQGLQTGLLSASGRVTEIAYGSRETMLKYESTGRMLISLSSLPTSITVDGSEFQPDVMKGSDCYSVFLPVGNHTARILMGDQFSYGVTLTSLWSSNAIALFGTSAVFLLIVMYTVLKILKVAARFRRSSNV